MTAITGNTYPVRDQLKALGGQWNAQDKAWMVPDDRAEEARRIVASAPQQTKRKRYHRSCAECGAPSRGYYRCYTCSLDYRDGGGMARGGASYYDRNGRFVLGDDD
jgi:hypothetical protein